MMDEISFNPERLECPERNARCTKLAAKAIDYFAHGGDSLKLDPRFGGLAWNFVGEQHYDHIAEAVTTATGVAVERADTPRRAGTDETPTYGLRLPTPED